MTVFHYSASAGQRLRVGWSDANHDYWFVAATDGDRITKVHEGGSRRYPVVFERYTGEGRKGSASYNDARQEPWAALVAEAIAQAHANGLVREAFRVKAEAEAEARASTIKAKAEAMRDVLRDLRLLSTLCATDAELAAAYDRVQSGSV